ncbi:MAG: hypothetical protein J0L58_12645 [Burkholderiales bacterium]|nr:hypothetical protein [Burkholderiales bacterium]
MLSDRRLAILLSFGVGLLSLSQEIVWFRVVGFAQSGHPQFFGLVLGAFLMGAAGGAAWGRALCQDPNALRAFAHRQLWIATAVDVLALTLMVLLLQPSATALPGLLLLIALCAACKASLFPLVHQLGSQASEGSSQLGQSLSTIYFANVIGSASGPLLTGYLLLEWVDAEAVFAGIALVTALLGWACCRPRWPAWMALVGALAACAHPPAVLLKVASDAGEPGAEKRIIQNRHGVIHTVRHPEGDVTFGGNAYDGLIQLDMRLNGNGLDRAYLMLLLHPNPKQVLMIGLSSGAWLSTILGMPGIERVDVVEVNPAYLNLVQSHPVVAPALRDPRVRIHIDDGRRWLRRHPAARFDLVFSNSSFYWRSHVGLLLSEEFHRLVQRHMRSGAVLAFNTTGSRDALLTAETVFANVARYKGFGYASDAPLVRRPDSAEALRLATLNGQPAFADPAWLPGSIGHTLLNAPLQSASQLTRGVEPAPRVIQDHNPINEFRHGAAPLHGAVDAWLPNRPTKF